MYNVCLIILRLALELLLCPDGGYAAEVTQVPHSLFQPLKYPKRLPRGLVILKMMDTQKIISTVSFSFGDIYFQMTRQPFPLYTVVRGHFVHKNTLWEQLKPRKRGQIGKGATAETAPLREWPQLKRPLLESGLLPMAFIKSLSCLKRFLCKKIKGFTLKTTSLNQWHPA